MIHFTRISARDTFSYREQQFAFQPGLSAIEGLNGSSKSSLFLTLQQGLFNRNAKGCKVDEVNNRITAQPYEIYADFTKGNDEYQIVNSRKDGRIDIFKNGRNIALKRIPDNLLLIQEILGCDFSMFCDLTYQNKDSSLDLLETGTDKGRKQFINRILKLAEIDEQFNRMKEKGKELGGKTGKIAFLKARLETLESSLGTEMEVSEEEPVSSYQDLRNELDERIEVLREEKRCLEYSLKSIASRLAERKREEATRARIASLQSTLSQYTKHDIVPEDLEEEIDLLREKETNLWVQIRVLSDEIARAEATVEKRALRQKLIEEIADMDLGPPSEEDLRSWVERDNNFFATEPLILKQLRSKIDEFEKAIATGDCPTCGAKVPKEAFTEDIAILKEEGRKRKAILEERKIAHADYLAALAQYDRKAKLEREIEKLATPYVEVDLETLHATYQAEREKLLKLQSEIRELQDMLSEYHKIADLERDIAVLVASIKDPDSDEDLEAKHETLMATLVETDVQLNACMVEREDLYDRLHAIEKKNATVRATKALNAQIETNNARIRLEMDQAAKELEDAERRLDLVKEWQGILGDKGYRVAKVDRFLRTLNTTMQKYSQMICEGRIKAAFFITSEGEIDFTITDEAKSMDYTLWSGGEKARVRLVTLFAVLELLEVMGSVSFNVLCLDEVFDQLDADGKAGLFRVLEYLKQKNKALYVIAHSELALDLVYDNVVRAVKNQDGTTELIQ